MLRGENHAGHARVGEGLRPLVRVEVRRIEDIGSALAPAPLFVRERVVTEMEERVVFLFVPGQLPWRGRLQVGAGGAWADTIAVQSDRPRPHRSGKSQRSLNTMRTSFQSATQA